MLRVLPLALACLLAFGASGCSAEPQGRITAAVSGGDWTRFGYDAARHNAGPVRTGITRANVRRLRRQRVVLDGTVDSSPIYLRGVHVGRARHDVFFVTTSYGKTIAVDAKTGGILWRFTPSGYSSWAGSERITNSSPVADPNRRFIFAGAPDGKIHKLAVASGAEVRAASWPAAITRLPTREKLGTALNVSRGLVLATTGGFIGDAPPYQGHVAAIDARSGRLVHVWNALCSNRHGLIVPRTCGESGAAIWARSGVVVDPATGNLLVATGDGRFDGRTNWGDSVAMLSPAGARLLRNWTPRDQASLDSGDVDLGSTAPALLARGLAVQSGKDGKLRLLSLHRLGGRLGRTGGELQTLPTPGGAGLFSAPAVWRKRVFVVTNNGVWCYALSRGRLHVAWRHGGGGTSPVIAGGLLYVYNGSLRVYAPTTGKLLASFRVGGVHWNSPIVTDGRVAVGEGDANDHSTSGALDIFRLR